MFAAQSDLFAVPSFDGFAYADTIVAPAEEQALVAGIDRSDLSPFRFQGWLGKRLTASFGWKYDFDSARLGAADPIPDFLLPLRDTAARFAGMQPEDFVQSLVIRYDPGAGIGWHRDRPIFEHVIGISLGNPATMRFRRRSATGFDRFAAPLAPRSIYHLCGEARHGWEHSIAAMEVPRWSVTFRSFSDKGRKMLEQAA